MTPAGLHLLLTERSARADAEAGRARRADDGSAVQQYADPAEFAALAAMSTA